MDLNLIDEREREKERYVDVDVDVDVGVDVDVDVNVDVDVDDVVYCCFEINSKQLEENEEKLQNQQNEIVKQVGSWNASLARIAILARCVSVPLCQGAGGGIRIPT